MDPFSLDELRAAAAALAIPMSDDELAAYEPWLAAFTSFPEEPEPVQTRAVVWTRPTGEDNPLGAWYARCSVPPTESGVLDGKSVVLKDTIALAGVPMASGTAALEGFVPTVDATVVTRILAAGGTIVGKAVCEELCVTAGSHTAHSGFVRNPHDPTRAAGGSSSGCGALVGAGACDLAIGGDQGGSIRIPASLCGINGLKPTHGLVPYTGALPLDPTIDHLGPMGARVGDVAALLEAIAGPDGLDPRQHGAVLRPYLDRLDAGIDGLRIGVLTEGFGGAGEVDDVVRAAADAFSALGATVAEVSVPEHLTSGGLLSAILPMAVAQWVLRGEGVGMGWEGRYWDEAATAFAFGRREHGAAFSPAVKLMGLAGEALRARHGMRFYAAAQNQRPAMRAAYDRVLEEVDVLVMPTAAAVAQPLPAPDADVAEVLMAGFSSVRNTAQFDLTGHPAMSVPCGTVDGMPVGMMLVGRRWEDDLVLRTAYAFEQR